MIHCDDSFEFCLTITVNEVKSTKSAISNQNHILGYLTCLSLVESNPATADTSGRVSGLISSFNVAAVGKVFFSTVDTFFSFAESNPFTSARELTASSVIVSRVGRTDFNEVKNVYNT